MQMSFVFAAIPYLVEIAAKLPMNELKDLWVYLGCWISTHEEYRKRISEDMLECFDLALRYAEKVCIEQITSVEKLDDTDAHISGCP